MACEPSVKGVFFIEINDKFSTAMNGIPGNVDACRARGRLLDPHQKNPIIILRINLLRLIGVSSCSGFGSVPLPSTA